MGRMAGAAGAGSIVRGAGVKIAEQDLHSRDVLTGTMWRNSFVIVGNMH